MTILLAFYLGCLVGSLAMAAFLALVRAGR